jgi:hypothetical protein
MEPQVTTKIWVSTLKKVKVLAALRGCSMVKLLDDLITEELTKEFSDLGSLAVLESVLEK